MTQLVVLSLKSTFGCRRLLGEILFTTPAPTANLALESPGIARASSVATSASFGLLISLHFVERNRDVQIMSHRIREHLFKSFVFSGNRALAEFVLVVHLHL